MNEERTCEEDELQDVALHSCSDRLNGQKSLLSDKLISID